MVTKWPKRIQARIRVMKQLVLQSGDVVTWSPISPIHKARISRRIFAHSFCIADHGTDLENITDNF